MRLFKTSSAWIRAMVWTLCCLMGLVSCERDIDLNHIDATAALSMGIAMPIGEATATLGDFIHDQTLSHVYVREDGVFCYLDTLPIETKEFHAIDLSRFACEAQAAIPPVSATLPVEIELSGLNTDSTNERVDSIHITSASLTLVLDTTQTDLQWEEIAQLTITPGKEFLVPAGWSITPNLTGHTYGDSIVTPIDPFGLCFMRDPSDPRAGSGHTLHMGLNLTITTKGGRILHLTPDSRLICSMRLRVNDYEAIWGYFKAGNQMSEIGGFTMDSVLGRADSALRNLNIRLAEPAMAIAVNHHVAAPLVCKIYSLHAYTRATQQTIHATWNNNPYVNLPLEPTMDPVHAALTDSVTNMVHFSSNPSEGHIDQLFDPMPDSIGYNFEIIVDQNYQAKYPQHRLVRNTKVHSNVQLSVPFIFKENSYASYTFTIDSVNLSSMSLDSIVHDIEGLDSVKTADLKLWLTIRNGIPFALKAHMEFLDAQGRVLPMHPFAGDSICIAAPTDIRNRIVMTPAQTDMVVALSKNEWRQFANVKSIRLSTYLGDNPATVQLDTHTQLAIKMGLSAKAEAILDLSYLWRKEEPVK